MAVPRDASMQYEHGQEVAIGQDKLDDVVFKNEEGRITHVGISNGQGQGFMQVVKFGWMC